MTLKEVLYVPYIMCNLIPLSRLRQNNLTTLIVDNNNSNRGSMRVWQKSSVHIIRSGLEHDDGLYQALLNMHSMEIASLAVNEKGDVWHQELVHLSKRFIKEPLRHIPGIAVEEELERSDLSYCSVVNLVGSS